VEKNLKLVKYPRSAAEDHHQVGPELAKAEATIQGNGGVVILARLQAHNFPPGKGAAAE
jgi:hypothetical protein